MDKIIVRDLLMRAIIGINPDERVKKQDILVNLVLYADTKKAAETDDIDDAVNYKTISKQVIDRVENGSDYLVEKLVNDIARMILHDYPQVQKVQVRVEKPGALRFARSVGVEIERTREDFGL
ncbi:MAG: dihydroneopterin aldolase [Anaerolineales bacterium]|nr:dihydroneopterin aldolase [Anaerolineales bacterium]MCA9975750.1 dihydroneopterin aldolase [Anaerolineales bacterium]